MDHDQHVRCDRNHIHWGRYGAAGALLRHVGVSGTPRYLLLQRSPHTDSPGLWSIPGGAMAAHETPKACAMREATEEIGPMPIGGLAHTHTNDHGGWAYHTLTGDVGSQFEPRLDDEHQDYGWFTPQEVGELPLHPGFQDYWGAQPQDTPSFKHADAGVQIVHDLSLASVAHNLHYRFEEGKIDANSAREYATQLLGLIGYQNPDDVTVMAALQAWQQMYPGDRTLQGSSDTGAIEAPATTPSESWGYGTVGKTAEAIPSNIWGDDDIMNWEGPSTKDLRQLELEHRENLQRQQEYVDSTPTRALLHAGQIPGDENWMGDVSNMEFNPNMGVNLSYQGYVNGQPAYVKTTGETHDNDLSHERAAFAYAKAMGVPMPHTLVREVNLPHPQHPEGLSRPAQVQQDVGGRSLMETHAPDDVNLQWPQRARHIALLDNVIGNHDRHMGNVVMGDDGDLYPIDHGGSFQAPEEYDPSGLAKIHANTPLTPDEQNMLTQAWQVDPTVMGVDPYNATHAKERIATMLDTGRMLPNTSPWG